MSQGGMFLRAPRSAPCLFTTSVVPLNLSPSWRSATGILTLLRGLLLCSVFGTGAATNSPWDEAGATDSPPIPFRRRTSVRFHRGPARGALHWRHERDTGVARPPRIGAFLLLGLVVRPQDPVGP